MENLETQQPIESKRRFTTLIDNNLLSQIKLISYFTNQKFFFMTIEYYPSYNFPLLLLDKVDTDGHIL